ncbi:MAG: transmembrane anchor protein [Gemmatimonas sp.]
MPHVTDAPDVQPSSRTLLRSTLVAFVVAGTLLATVVLPAEYGVDPTGIGRVLGLTEMGRIKMALAREAVEADAAEKAAGSGAPDPRTAAIASVAAPGWRDSMTVTLAPGKGIELKLAMRAEQRATYEWRASSPEVTYNAHGEPPNPPKGFSHSYARGISDGEQGDMVAAFDGMHGWFWRNRSAGTVTITLKTRGEYQELREMK